MSRQCDSLQAGDDLDILPHALDIYPTAPALSLQAGADKGTIRLGQPACGIFMVRVATQDDGKMGHGLLDLPYQTSVGFFIWMGYLDRVCAHTCRHSGNFGCRPVAHPAKMHAMHFCNKFNMI